MNKIKEIINDSDYILIGAGAGMGVDSGLPDFRGKDGFWNAYPAFKGKRFEDIANPRTFESDIQLAWGFYGHRHELYSRTNPHSGYKTLLNWLQTNNKNYFIYTSNVDGHFLKAGYDPKRMMECHGNIYRFQCMYIGCGHMWKSSTFKFNVDTTTMKAQNIPHCPECGFHARPNILMFGDWDFDFSEVDRQRELYIEWISKALESHNCIALEFGAGTTITTVREACSTFKTRIRINPRDAKVNRPQDHSIPMGAKQAIDLLFN